MALSNSGAGSSSICDWNDDWDWYWDDNWWEDINPDDFWDDNYPPGSGDYYNSSSYWYYYFRALAASPQTITPHPSWGSSDAERVFNNLRVNSPTFDGIINGFENQNQSNLMLLFIDNSSFKEMVLKAQGQYNPNSTATQNALNAAKTAFGSTYINAYNQTGGGMVIDADASVNINANLFDANGNQLTLNDLGLALTIIHESIHAAYVLDLPQPLTFIIDQDHQHDDMSTNHRQVIEDALREYVAANNANAANTPIQLQAAPIDEFVLLSWNGLLKTDEGIDYIISYAQIVDGVTFTVVDKDHLTPQEILNLNTYIDVINQRILSLTTQ